MNAPSDANPSDAKGFDTKHSKGLMMVAAFRAERLRQRPVPRDNPRQYHPARYHPVEPTGYGMADAPPPEQASVIATVADAISIFANLVSLAAAERNAATAAQDHGSATPPSDDRDEAKRSLDVQAERAASEQEPSERELGEKALGEKELGEKELGENARIEAASPPAAPDAMPADAMPADTMPADAVPADAVPADTAEPTPSMVPEEQSPPHDPPPHDPPPHDPPPHDPPLAEIGFGPGMLIRLSQLGLHTTADLARTDPGQLRVALGDISRLVNVETWIDHAKQAARPASS